MKFTTRSFAVATSLAFLAVLTGCSSTKVTESVSASDVGVMCNMCKTTYATVPVTTVGDPHNQGVRVIGERKVGTHECPECKQIATDYIQAGKARVPNTFVHSCKMCGGELKTCRVNS